MAGEIVTLSQEAELLSSQLAALKRESTTADAELDQVRVCVCSYPTMTCCWRIFLIYIFFLHR